MHRRIITLEQLKSAMLIQLDDDVNGRGHRRLGSILFDEGMITEEQIDIVLREVKMTLS